MPGGYNANISSPPPAISNITWISGPAEMGKPYKYCKGGYSVHGICILTSGDLHTVKSKVNLSWPIFHNKYFTERDHTIMDCMEEELVRRNKLEYINDCH